jgi:WD40 repeat protein
MPRHTFAVLAGLFLVSSAKAQLAIDPLGDPLPPGAVARLGSLRFKHPYGPNLSNANIPIPVTITALCFSPDGTRIASAAAIDGTVRVWDTATGKAVPGAWDYTVVSCEHGLAFSPDGKVLAIYGRIHRNYERSMVVMLWDVGGGKLLRILPEDDHVWSMAFADGGKTVVTTHEDTVRWGDVATGQKIKSWQPLGPAIRSDEDNPRPSVSYHLDLSPGGKYLRATVWKRDPKDKLSGQEFVLFDLAAAKELWRVRDREVGKAGTFFSADDRHLARLFGMEKLELYDQATGKHLLTLPLAGRLDPDVTVRALALSPDGSTVAIAGRYASVAVWCPRDRKWRTYAGRPTQPHVTPIRSLAFSADGTRLAVGANSDVQLVDVATLREVLPCDGHRSWVEYVAFSADGKRLLTGSAQDDLQPREVLTWDTATWKRLGIPPSDLKAAGANVGVVSPDHTLYLGKDGDDRLNLYDYATGKPLGRLEAPAKLHPRARGFFAPGGRFFVSFNEEDGNDRVGHLYAIPSGKQLCKLPKFFLPGSAGLRPVALSPDGRLVAVHCLNTAIYVLETATGKQVQRLGPQPGDGEWVDFANLAFSPDGKHLATWTDLDHAIHFWDVKTGKKWLTLPERVPDKESGAVYFAWSPDGRTFAVGAGKAVYVWELATQKLRCVLRGHQGEVRALAFSPDGGLLASGSIDTTVLVWDITGRLQMGPRQRRWVA